MRELKFLIIYFIFEFFLGRTPRFFWLVWLLVWFLWCVFVVGVWWWCLLVFVLLSRYFWEGVLTGTKLSVTQLIEILLIYVFAYFAAPSALGMH